MIKFYLNGKYTTYNGDPDKKLLSYLRNEINHTCAKDGCSGQGMCGACTVEINGKAALSCITKMRNIDNAEIITLEGLPDEIKNIIAEAFVNKGAVQCGFCTPGLIMRTHLLFKKKQKPSREEIIQAIKPHLCRCTGYIKIVDAIENACKKFNFENITEPIQPAVVGSGYPKYQAFETALGLKPYTDDIYLPDMLFGALKFSDYPRAKIHRIDYSAVEKLPGVIKVLTAADVPGQRFNGLIFNDWPLMIAEGETTRYIGDVLALVVAENEETARIAADSIFIEYRPLTPVTDVFEAISPEAPSVHRKESNLLEECVIDRGDVENAFSEAAFISKGRYETQRIEHAFLETECAVAQCSQDNDLILYSQTQGIYEDRRQISKLLDLPQEKITVIQVSNGGGFGGKEDLTVQGHAALAAFRLKRPVKVKLTREQSLIMHPKRHPIIMDIEVCADRSGKLTGLKLNAWGDTGAYASVGTKVMERLAGHASGGYYIPNLKINSKTIYTNNIPCGAMRGFGVPQINFALESCIDDICEKGNFDRWQIRYDNALDDGLPTSTGQKVRNCGIKACLEALKDDFRNAPYAGIATGVKNSGIGNGMKDFCRMKIEILSGSKVKIHHGWTEMGQGIHTIAIQVLCNETQIPPQNIEVVSSTASDLLTGMTTSSRAAVLLGNAIIDACKALKTDLETNLLEDLSGKTYFGYFEYDKSTKPGAPVDEPITHYSYGYAAQVCTLDNDGKIDTIYAAHDAGKILNRTIFEGQMQGSIQMGLGYALSENFPMKNGFPESLKFINCGVLRSVDMPNVVIKGVEINDENGPFGAKGIGEIGLVPTAPAVINALYQFNKKRHYKLPIKR